MKRSLYAVLFLATLPALAQTSPKPAESPKVPTVAVPTTAPAATTSPMLTETEKLKVENIQLRFTVMQLQQQLAQAQQQISQATSPQLQSEYESFVKAITAEYPGFAWNPQTNSLIPAPKLPVPPIPPAAEKK